VQLLLGLFLLASTAAAFAQQYGVGSNTSGVPEGLLWPLTEAPRSQAPTTPLDATTTLPDAPSHTARPSVIEPSAPPPQIPTATLNLHAAGAGAAPSPSPPFKQYLNFATSNSGGSGALIFVGRNTAADPAGTDSGTIGSGTNCGHSSADKSNGSDWINSLLAITSHKGGRYCALGEGGFWKRGTYAMSRAFVAHRYDGANSFNASELLGPGIASAMPGSYYAYPNYTGERLAARYASAVGRDTLKNMFSEFWPDFATHVLRRRP